MTREEVIKELEILKENYWDDDGYGHETKQYDDTMLALEMAIKALEQEPIIGKIKAEIEKEIIPRNSDQYDHEAMWQNCGLRMALKAIDKYKAESEDNKCR